MSCSIITNDSSILLKDKKSGKSKMYILNPMRYNISKTEVDGCLVKEGKRCDFLIVDHNDIEYFIELKGKDVQYASEQIAESIKKISKNLYKNKHSFIVSTTCPMTTTEIQKLKIIYKRDFKSTLTIKNIKCEHLLE